MVSSFHLLSTSEMARLGLGYTHGLILVIINLLAFREARKSFRPLEWTDLPGSPHCHGTAWLPWKMDDEQSPALAS